MIPVLLRDLLPRFLLVALAAVGFYFIEPGFHPHEHVDPLLDTEYGPLGLAASLGNLATVAMLILLADMISGDRRRGYARLYFSHPTSPYTLYGVRAGIALVAAITVSLLFLTIGQWAAWGEFRGGWEGLTLAAAAAIAFGGLVVGLSALLPRGDAWVAVGAYAGALVWQQVLAFGAEPFTPAVRQAIALILPPLPAIQDYYEGILTGDPAWNALAFVVGYGLVWVLIGALALRVREW